MALPPVFAASALYDSLLQSALRQFFGRATFETEPIPSLSSDGRLAIEPTHDPSVLSIRWFGSRHVLHVPARRPFTPHEVRLAKAIGSVLALRYRAIFDPKQMLERGDLFRGSIEDRYISAFLNADEQNDAAHARADLVATALEILRVAALSSYENKAISSGVLLVDEDAREPIAAVSPSGQSYKYSPALTGIKSFYRLSDGIETLFLVNRDGTVLDIVEVARYVTSASRVSPVILDVACPTTYRFHAKATGNNRNICLVLSPSHEIKVFAQGVEVFSFSNARWHLLDMQAKYEMWERAVENAGLASSSLPDGARSLRTPGRARCSSSCAMPRRRSRCSSRPATGSTRQEARPVTHPTASSFSTCSAAEARSTWIRPCWPASPRPTARRSWTVRDACWRSAPSSCTPSRWSHTRRSPSRAPAPPPRWPPGGMPRSSRSARTG